MARIACILLTAGIVILSNAGAARGTSVPVNDPLFASQWYLSNDGNGGKKAGADVNAPAAWLIQTGMPSIVIAVLDDGIDMLHEDLVNSIYINAGEIPGNGIDDDANGYIDDVSGWDFLDNDADASPSTGNKHGTEVSGIITATANNNIGIAGIANGCRLLPVRSLSTYVPGDAVAEAILYAGSIADVIVICYTFPVTTATSNALNEVMSNGRSGKGCAVFAPTGNDGSGTVAFPAKYPGIFGVGASTAWDVRPAYSQYGSGIDFVAPGGNTLAYIATTDRTGSKGNSPGNYFTNFVGTSASAPLAAGIAALVLSRYPAMTLGELETVLKGTCAKIGDETYDSKGWNQYYGYGRLDARKAVAGECAAYKVSPLSPPDHSTAATRTPLLEWAKSLRATWYQLWIHRNGSTYFTGWMQTNSWQAPVDLAGGNYTWWVKAYNKYGSSWSAGSHFTVTSIAPGKATLLTPDGIVQPPGPVNFTWSPADEAKWYRIWCNRDGRTLFTSAWTTDTAYTTNDLPFGSYQWWVQAYGIDGAGPWSDPMSFTYGLCVPLTPQGDMGNTNMPVFTWQAVDQATWYNIYIKKTGLFFASQWIKTNATWTPAVPLPDGDYRWWVRPWKPGGSGTWSDEADFSVLSP